MKLNTFVITLALIAGIFSPQVVRAQTTPSLGDLLELAKALGEFFGGEEYEPDLLADNDPCSLNFSLTNLRGVFGNGKFVRKSFSINDFWKGSLRIDGREGFIKNDILQISGSIQHKTDFCDQRTNDPGSPITFLINLDLNNMNIVDRIDRDGQIVLTDPNLPKSKRHNTSNGVHQDILELVSLNANIFDNNEEIGLYNIDIQASHNSSNSSCPIQDGNRLLSFRGYAPFSNNTDSRMYTKTIGMAEALTFSRKT